MAVIIAEYLGQRTDIDYPIISPAKPKSGALCPFMDRACDKNAKGYHPVCSVRKPDGELWINCEHRLCATYSKKKVGKKDVEIGLVDHQIDILNKVATTIYPNNFKLDDIGVRREVPIPLDETRKHNYHADYIMRNFTNNSKVDEILLEMQGGGECSGSTASHMLDWENSTNRDNALLRTPTSKASVMVTNAWRRQQEQFLVKGNVVSQTGGKIVFAVGSLINKYLQNKFKNTNLTDLRKHNWTLCILPFKEDKSQPAQHGAIPLEVDEENLLFTNYSTFVRFLTDQGVPSPEIFEGDFISLKNQTITVK
jgi:hypothetical protein